jgi:diguanylate cyclase (GGDEF)-like protein
MVSLYDLAKSLAGRISFSDAADIIAKHLRRMIPASTFVFYLFDEEMDELAAGHAAGEHASHFAGLRIARGQRLSGWVAANLRSVLNSDPVLDLGEVARSVRPPLRGCLSTPLVYADELVGVLTAYSTQRDAFSEDHQRILEAVARQVGQTLKHAVIFDKERQERLRDQITGLPNLKQLERFIAAELRTPSLSGDLAIILIEIRSGIRSTTPADSVISSVAEIIRQGLGGADVLFRYSESALIVLMTSTDRRTAIHVAEGASERLSSFVAAAGAGAPSATLGVATAPADGLTLPDLVDAAKRQPVANPPRNHPPSVH